MNVNVQDLIRIFPAKMQEFKDGTAKDKVLQQLSQQVVKGWPDSVKEVDLKVKTYWSLRADEILVENGLVLLGSCVIVPAESLRCKILQQIHRGHFGIEKCKLQAKSCVHWPSIYRAIESLVNACRVCQKYQTSHQKEPMIPSEINP